VNTLLTVVRVFLVLELCAGAGVLDPFHFQAGCTQFITDCASVGSNAIASFHLSVHLFPSDILTFCKCMGHGHSYHGLKVKVRVRVRFSLKCSRWDLSPQSRTVFELCLFSLPVQILCVSQNLSTIWTLFLCQD